MTDMTFLPAPFSRCALLAAGTLAGFLTLPAAAADEALNIDQRLELFIDSYLIDRLDGARLKMHEPKLAGIALRFDDPWDGACSGFVTVLKDGDVLRMYYRGLAMENTDEAGNSYVCYAESRDGITWRKPDLEFVEFRGSRKNNILLPASKEEAFATNFTPFIDERPGVPPAERLKAVGGVGGQGLYALVSADGIHWKKWRDAPIFTKGAFDSQNIVFWSASENCYVLYFRVSSDVGGPDMAAIPRYRTVSKSTSPDLLHWTDARRMSFGNSPLEELYTTATTPYFRAPHIYIALPMRYVAHRTSLTPAQFAALEVVPAYANIKGANKQHDIPHEMTDAVLMTSRGGYRFQRTFLEAFIRPGPDLGNWVSRSGLNAKGIIPTGATEISLYHQFHYGQKSASLARYTLRTDGFASVNAPYAGGEMVTKPVAVTGARLVINFATSAPGGIRVELQEADGEPIPGYTLQEAEDLVGDALERTVGWKRGPDLGSLAGRTIRIRFVMKDADLYALRFR